MAKQFTISSIQQDFNGKFTIHARADNGDEVTCRTMELFEIGQTLDVSTGQETQPVPVEVPKVSDSSSVVETRE
jgi:hypothetical protein